MKRNPRKDHQTTIVHFGFSTPEQVKELKELGAIVSANPYYTVHWLTNTVKQVLALNALMRWFV